MLGGTLITKILLSSKSLRLSLLCQYFEHKIRHKWSGLFDFQVQGFFVLVGYMIRWTRLRISRIFSHYCNFFSFPLNKNSSGKVTFSILLLVLPFYINCKGRNLFIQSDGKRSSDWLFVINTRDWNIGFSSFSHPHWWYLHIFRRSLIKIYDSSMWNSAFFNLIYNLI